MTGSSLLLWIVIAVLLVIVAVLAWRLWHASHARPAAGDASCQDTGAEISTLPIERGARPRSAAPPPASAGGEISRRGAPPAARTSHGGAAGGSGEERDYAANRRRTSKPPPALAGHIPGVAHAPATAPPQQRARSGARPPPASAGGAGRDDDASDPEPARRRSEPPHSPAFDTDPARALCRATSWGYQLQDVELAQAEAAPFDLIVIDYSRDGSEEEAYTPTDLARLKRAGARARRLVYAYISVGEAESYRYYWDRAWKRKPPRWLIGENKEWRENYYVRFWDRDWQDILFGAADSYIGRIAAAGFDGIYLDRCDVYEEIGEHHPRVAREREDIEADMAQFVEALSQWVRREHPGLGIIMQNAEGLLANAGVRAAIDGSAKEELLFGLSRAERRNTRDEVDRSREALDLMRKSGKAVFVVEYIDAPELRLEAAGSLRAMGYVPYMARTDRELATLEMKQPEPAIA